MTDVTLCLNSLSPFLSGWMNENVYLIVYTKIALKERHKLGYHKEIFLTYLRKIATSYLENFGGVAKCH